MSQKMIENLMEKLGIAPLKKYSQSKAESLIASSLEEEGFPQDLGLTKDEKALLEKMGFDVDEIPDAGDDTEAAPKKKGSDKKEKEAPKGKDEDDDPPPKKKGSDKKEKEAPKKKSAPKEKKEGKCWEIDRAIEKILTGKKPMSRADIIEKILKQIPDASEGTIGVRLSRGKSKDKKKNPLNGILIQTEDKKLTFK